jgi:microsomal prostaglandin-E synthase 1
VIVDKAGPALLAYAVVCVVLVADMLFLWVYSGVVRARGGVAINPEDAARFGVPLSEIDPPQVARVLRAHANAQATIFPFLTLALAFALIGGSLPSALILFTIFTAARIAHSAAYLRGAQPWRTLSFIVGGLTTIVLIVLLVWRVAFVAMGGVGLG